MDLHRITHPLRSAKRSHQPARGKECATNGPRRVGIAGMAILAAVAFGAAPAAKANSTDFFAAVQAAGISAVAPAMLANGNNVCWQIWNGGYTGAQAAAALQRTYPTLTTDQAARFVLAAYQNLCPVPGSYDWWSYGNGSPG
jgi:2,4-dienoyl-CoA reductase-like NADH-dependent reductase (Old Yellow Enzyme family)